MQQLNILDEIQDNQVVENLEELDLENSEFKSFSILDIYDVTNGLSKGREEFGFGFPFLTFKEVFYNYFLPEELINLANSSENERKKCSIKRGDVFITRTSETFEELGTTCVALKDYPDATFNGFTKRLRPKDGFEILPEYAAFYFKTQKFRDQILSLTNMTTRASLNNDMMKFLTISLPNINTQRKIANILKSLHDKIELNQKMNKTLEEMAQAIFKHWFIDFEFPNEEGKPYKSSGGEMIDSELGEIPMGWKNSNLGDVIDTISKTHKFEKKEIIFLNTSDILEGRVLKTNFSDIETLPGQAKKSIKRNDILFTEIRPANKRYAFINFDADDYVVSTKLMVLRARDGINPYLIYCYLTNNEILNELQRQAESRSGTFPQITFDNIKILNFTIADKVTLEKAGFIIENLYNRIFANSNETEKLISIRDSLLPKLMSGEIRTLP